MADRDEQLAEVVALELQLLAPRVRADREEAQRLLHPDFREIGPSGIVWDREAIVEELQARPGEHTEVRDVQARAVSDGVVLVTYMAAGTSESLRSSIWVREEDGWRVLFHQRTPSQR
ncbi:MAG: nuclear transport factor 2 family protein [Actinomycetota bacterium]|nr:nuclear transport factor 2 family protein [Actinomycetota bacterium]